MRLAINLMLVLLTVACRGGEPVVPVGRVSTVVDTANGVEVVTNSGVPPVWRLDALLTLGAIGGVSDPLPDEFARVANAVWGPGERVYVADEMNAEIKVFGLDGSLLARFGRKGGGPGEFGSIYSMAWMGDSLLVLDFGVGRVGIFDPEGRWLGQRTHAGSITGSQKHLRLFQTGPRETYAISLTRSAEGLARIFLRHTPDGIVDTVAALRTPPVTSSVVCDHPNGSISFFGIPFAPAFMQHPAQQRLIAIARSDVYRIAFVNRMLDTVRIVERVLDPVPVDPNEWEAGLAEYRAYRDENPGASCEPGTPRRPDLEPPIRDLVLDPMGRLWVKAITPEGPFWEVFDPLGRLLGRVPVFPLGDRIAPYMADEHVVGVHRDSLDVDLVTVYKISR